MKAIEVVSNAGAARSQGSQDYITTITSWMMVALFAIAALIFLVTPLLALSWAASPFPGFVVEQTLVVSDYDGAGWSGRISGMNYPERVVAVNWTSVRTPSELQELLSRFQVGDTIQVQTVLPDGTARAYPSLELVTFPTRDLVRLFWLPYLVGLAYGLIGLWVYIQRWNTRPGRAFAFFCAWAAIGNGLLFDLITTHIWSAIWLVAITQQGGGLASLALLFPEEGRVVQRRPWLRFLPVLVSLALAIWGLVYLNDNSDPWAYVVTWRYSFFFAAFGILILLGVMIYRMYSTTSQVIRQQVRIILWGSLVAFLPLGVWLGGPLFGVMLHWNPVLFLPLMLFFPVSISVAILRYHLWDLEFILNRTLVYSILTIMLASIYFISVVALQQILLELTGQGSPLAIAISTLGTAVLFIPLRNRVQNFIDRRFFRRKYDASRTLSAFSATLRDEVDLAKLSANLLAVVKETMEPAHVRLCDNLDNSQENGCAIAPDDPLYPLLLEARDGVWVSDLDVPSKLEQKLRQEKIELAFPLVSQGELVGLLKLGPRRSQQAYSPEDRRLLSMLASQAAPALRVAHLVLRQQVEALERQRIDHELRVARLIQQTLLPKQMPVLPGWQMAGFYQPARAVGGDYYDFIYFPDGRLGLVIGDVTDKGVPAALVMSTARSLLRSTALQVVAPGKVLQQVNDLLVPDIPINMFITCLYALLDPSTGRMVFANAGHCLPCCCANGEVSELRATGMPLGLLPGMKYEETEAVIAPGEMLLLYSDGLIEAHNRQHEMVGLQRMMSWMVDHTGSSDLITRLMAELNAFTGEDYEQEDDVTLVTVQHFRE